MMAITPPVAGQQISATSWGIPISDEVNRLTPLVDKHERPMICRLFLNGNVSVNSGVGHVVAWSGEAVDNASLHAPSSSRITVPTGGAGIWLIGGWLVYNGASAGNCSIRIYKNGNTAHNIGYAQTKLTGPADYTALGTSVALVLNVNDYVELIANQGSGGAIVIFGNADPDALCCNFWAVRIGSI